MKTTLIDKMLWWIISNHFKVIQRHWINLHSVCMRLLPLNTTFDQKTAKVRRICHFGPVKWSCVLSLLAFAALLVAQWWYLYHWNLWNLSFHMMSCLCRSDHVSNISTVSYVLNALALFRFVLIQTLGVRVVFCFGKNGSYRQVAEFFPWKKACRGYGA